MRSNLLPVIVSYLCDFGFVDWTAGLAEARWLKGGRKPGKISFASWKSSVFESRENPSNNGSRLRS